MTQKQFVEFEQLYKSQKNDKKAMKLLADLYLHGSTGKEYNIEKAFPYYKIAADMGDCVSAGMVGSSLLSGYGCKVDTSAGFRYLKMAVDGGLNTPGAQKMIADCYCNGIGCSENDEMAIKYYRMAALQNDAEAQFKCGSLMFLDKNHSDEYLHWWCCSHLNGFQDATEALNDFIKSGGRHGDASGFRQTVEWEIEDIKKNGIIPKSKSNGTSSHSTGCYVATAVYGSYDCPEVWTLRRFRDEVLAKTWRGRIFIRLYYATSPAVVKLFGNCQWFQSFFRRKLDKMVSDLQSNGFQSTPYQDCEG